MNYVAHLKYHDIGKDTLNNKSHIHIKEFEILHILSGTGVVMIKDKLYELTPDTVFFINGEDAHYTSPDTSKDYLRNKIIFSGKSLLELSEMLSVFDLVSGLFNDEDTAIKLSAESSYNIDELFLKLSKLSRDDTDLYNINFFINIFSIIDVALKNKKSAVKNINNKISDVISYINMNIENKISLDDICNSAKVSKYYLCRKFKETVGMTVFSYIELMRLSKAKELLTKTDLSISEISVKTGFESFAYFSKIFKKSTDCTPSEYRKNNFIY